MNVRLDPVSLNNWEEVIKIDLEPEQWANVDPPSVLHALCESQFWPTFNSFVILDGDEQVGFVVHGIAPTDPAYWAVAILIVEKTHQHKGFGREAMTQVIAQAKAVEPPLKGIAISYRPGNIAAKALYTSLGFEPFLSDETDIHACLRFPATAALSP